MPRIMNSVARAPYRGGLDDPEEPLGDLQRGGQGLQLTATPLTLQPLLAGFKSFQPLFGSKIIEDK